MHAEIVRCLRSLEHAVVRKACSSYDGIGKDGKESFTSKLALSGIPLSLRVSDALTNFDPGISCAIRCVCGLSRDWFLYAPMGSTDAKIGRRPLWSSTKTHGWL